MIEQGPTVVSIYDPENVGLITDAMRNFSESDTGRLFAPELAAIKGLSLGETAVESAVSKPGEKDETAIIDITGRQQLNLVCSALVMAAMDLGDSVEDSPIGKLAKEIEDEFNAKESEREATEVPIELNQPEHVELLARAVNLRYKTMTQADPESGPRVIEWHRQLFSDLPITDEQIEEALYDTDGNLRDDIQPITFSGGRLANETAIDVLDRFEAYARLSGPDIGGEFGIDPRFAEPARELKRTILQLELLRRERTGET